MTKAERAQYAADKVEIEVLRSNLAEADHLWCSAMSNLAEFADEHSHTDRYSILMEAHSIAMSAWDMAKRIHGLTGGSSYAWADVMKWAARKDGRD